MSHRPVDQWSAAELKAALLEDNADLSQEQIAAVQQFIDRIGGFENAQAAIELLQELELQDPGDGLDELDDEELQEIDAFEVDGLEEDEPEDLGEAA